jgi:hypothetical protein
MTPDDGNCYSFADRELGPAFAVVLDMLRSRWRSRGQESPAA